MDCVVTLDAGTGSGRCVVFDAAGGPLASAQEPFHYRRFTNPDVPFVRGFDLDPRAFWGALARCARTALAALPPGARIRGVIATSQREYQSVRRLEQRVQRSDHCDTGSVEALRASIGRLFATVGEYERLSKAFG